MSHPIPETASAVQLTGPDQLRLNAAKSVHRPGPMQILCKVEAVGLCFSDLKLLKQFSKHVRKGPVVRGIDPDILKGLPSYCPGEAPGVPGHEAVLRILEVGQGVTKHAVGERVLVQADWREIRTAQTNAAFGYTFEGALQEYVLLDERAVIEPSTGQRYLLPVGEARSASAIALVEPWACVEDSYVSLERNHIKPGGTLLVVCDAGREVVGLDACLQKGKPGTTLVFGGTLDGATTVESLDAVDEMSVDDIVYFGNDAGMIETFCNKLGTGGIANVVLGGKTIGRPVRLDIGRVHYGQTRWCGTTGSDPADGYAYIPETGEIRDGEKVLIVGAGGPMGQMHVIRDLCTGHSDVEVVATDFDQHRLDGLAAIVEPLAEANGVTLRMVNTKETRLDERFTYVALMAPVPALVAAAVGQCDEEGIINIFAGIPAGTCFEIDLDTYIARRLWMFGTSGSTIRDMQLVLDKVETGRLDTNLSVDAVSGMAGAIDGIRAVEHRTLGGKILVYPELVDLPLIPLVDLSEKLPAVAAKLSNGRWTKEAEEELLTTAV